MNVNSVICKLTVGLLATLLSYMSLFQKGDSLSDTRGGGPIDTAVM
jgi:hypothetical protein